MNANFIGEGWVLPTGNVRASSPTAQKARALGELQRPDMSAMSEVEKIQQSIWLILSTVPGERVMRPDFGCRIHQRVFENVGSTMLGQVASDVTEALQRWEPRIDVLGVEPHPDAREPSRLLITVHYVVPTINSRFNLVFPFYVS